MAKGGGDWKGAARSGRWGGELQGGEQQDGKRVAKPQGLTG